MRRVRTILLALLFLAPLASRVAYAQPEITSSVQAELERTDQILERARDQVGASTSSRAVTLLDQARQLQADAWDAFRSHPPLLAVAHGRTRAALNLARQALETAQIEVKAHESIRDLLQSTKDLIGEVAPVVRDQGDLEAKRLLDAGVWQLQDAESAYQSGEYRRAIALAATARDLVQRALQRSRGDTASGGSSALDLALDRTQAVLDEVRAGLDSSSGSNVQALFDEAQKLQDRARDLQRSQRPVLALRFTTRARQTALDALLQMARNPSQEEVERALAVVGQLITDVTPEITASGSDEARALLDSARQRQAESTDELSKGQAAQALETARIAEGLLRRAAEAAGIR